MNHKYRIIILVIILFGPCLPFCSAQVSPESISKPEETVQKKKSVGFWGEFYNESTSFQRNQDNLISSSHIKQGLRVYLIPRMPVETYLVLRYGKDLHRDFWNNRVEAGLGFRAILSRRVFLAIYLESIRGYYVKIPEGYPQPSEREYGDFRSGLIFWHGWDKTFPTSALISFPLNHFGELYSDVSYYRNQRNNVIGYFHAKSGLHLFRFWKSAIDGYGAIYSMKDINKDFWNNKVEFGPGIWLKPVPNLDLKVFVEWLQGYYFGIAGEDPNPYSQRYRDRRAGIIFWIGW